MKLEEPDSAQTREINRRGARSGTYARYHKHRKMLDESQEYKIKLARLHPCRKRTKPRKKVDHTPMTDDGRNEKRREEGKKITKK